MAEITNVSIFKYAKKGNLLAFANVELDSELVLKGIKVVKGRELDYMRAKQKLSSLYGMCAQDPCKTPIVYKDGMLQFDEDAQTELRGMISK